MKLKTLKDQYRALLAPSQGSGEAEALFHLVLETRGGISRLRYLEKSAEEVSDALRAQMESDLAALTADTPVQHLLGKVEFDGLSLAVGPEALIPRPETEELWWRLKQAWPFPPPEKVLDVGTGTGCLALACQAEWPAASVTGLDGSTKALDLARRNGESHKCPVHWLQADFLAEQERPPGPWDLVVSNPPYVRPAEKEKMAARVWQHEPAEALFTPADAPLIFYRALAEAYPPPTPMALELNRYTASAAEEVFRKKGHQTKIGEDSNGAPRFLWVNFSSEVNHNLLGH